MFDRLRRLFSRAKVERYEDCVRAVLDDPAKASFLDPADIPLTLAAVEAILEEEKPANTALAHVLLALEAYRLKTWDWPERLDPVIGHAARYGQHKPKAVEALGQAIAALPLARGEAILRPHYYHLRLEVWLEYCPSPLVLLSLARQSERYSNNHPSQSLRQALRGFEEGPKLLGESTALILDRELGSGARAIIPLAFEDDSLDRDAFSEVFREAFERLSCPDPAFMEAFATLSLDVREALVLDLPPSLYGPHPHVPTLAVAKLGVSLLSGDEPALGVRILEAMAPDHLLEALAEHQAGQHTGPESLQYLAWTLPRGLSSGGPIKRIEAVGGGSVVLDLVPATEGLLVTCADGSLTRLTDDHKTELRRGEELLPCRIVALTDEEVVLWGWETLSGLRRSDGVHLWDEELGHGLDEDEGDCSVSGGVAMLPNGWRLDLVTRDFIFDIEDDLAEYWIHAAIEDGFLVANGSNLERILTTSSRSLYRELPGHICAILSTEPLTLVIDGGKVVNEAGEILGQLTLKARETDGRARHYPGFPVEAFGAWEAGRITVAMNDRGGRLMASCLSGVAVFQEGETRFKREFKGRCAMAPGDSVAAVPGGLLVPTLDGRVMREIAIPGLMPSTMARIGDTRIIGTADGLVVYVEIPPWS